MPSDRFEKVSGEEQESRETVTEEDESVEEPTPDVEAPEDTDPQVPEVATPTTNEIDDDTDLSEPAFPYSNMTQTPVYPRDESVEAFEDAVDFEAKRALRDNGIRDVSKREIHDALFRLGAEHPERLADLIRDARK